MRGIKCVSDLDGEIRQEVGLERLALDQVLERLSFQQLHGDKGMAFVLVDVVYHADVRVIEGGSGARLALESFQGLRAFPAPVRFPRPSPHS